MTCSLAICGQIHLRKQSQNSPMACASLLVARLASSSELGCRMYVLEELTSITLLLVNTLLSQVLIQVTYSREANIGKSLQMFGMIPADHAW